MSHWREWANGQGLEGQDLDYFSTLLDSLAKDAPELFYSKTFTASCIRTEGETLEPLFELWPSSGILSDGVCLTAKTSESPNHGSASTLLGVIETGKVPEKYFLSPSAAKGMLRRARKMGRNLFPPLRESLETLAAKDR
jgi:DNA (cytosine-5)-methyltransferase 1